MRKTRDISAPNGYAGSIMGRTRRITASLIFPAALLLAPAHAYACSFRPLFGTGATPVFIFAGFAIAGLMLLTAIFHVLLQRRKKGKWLKDTLLPHCIGMTACVLPLVVLNLNDFFYYAGLTVWSALHPEPPQTGPSFPTCNALNGPGGMFTSAIATLFWLWIFSHVTRHHKLFPPFFKNHGRKKFLAIALVLLLWCAVHVFGWLSTGRWVVS